jgi:hypothetical protein
MFAAHPGPLRGAALPCSELHGVQEALHSGQSSGVSSTEHLLLCDPREAT